MTAIRSTLLRHPTALLAASVVLAVALGLVTSSLFGVGLFLILPSAVAWLLRR